MLSNLFLTNLLGNIENFPLYFNSNILVLLLSIPLLSIFIIFLTSEAGNRFHYVFALYSTGLSFILSVLLCYAFNPTIGGFQFTYSVYIVPSLPFALRFGVDGISLFFILLTNIFMYLCILSLNVSTVKLKEVLLHLLFLQ
jgi:NADH-quinone oxidoreductase subunit M